MIHRICHLLVSYFDLVSIGESTACESWPRHCEGGGGGELLKDGRTHVSSLKLGCLARVLRVVVLVPPQLPLRWQPPPADRICLDCIWVSRSPYPSPVPRRWIASRPESLRRFMVQELILIQLCVGPHHATREDDFFMELCLILMGKEEVTELYPVPDSHVPVMKFKFNRNSIDLVYARLSLWAIPDDLDISQESILQNVDEQCV